MWKKNIKPRPYLKLAILLIWAFLFILLLKRDYFISTLDISQLQAIEQATSEEYQAIFFKNKKIGYVINIYHPRPDNTQLLEQKAKMNLNIADTVHSIELQLHATLTADNRLINFDFSFKSPFYTMTATGKVIGKAVHYELATGTNIVKDVIQFKTVPMLATSRRTYLLTSGIQEGDKKRIPWFDPFSLTGKESILEYKGKEPVLINGRVHNLHRFTESFSGARVNSWLNDRGVVVKEESPAGFVFLREPKFKALNGLEQGDEILSAVAVQLQGEIGTISQESMQYRLTLPEGADLDLEGGRQSFKNNILTITGEQIPEQTSPAICPQADDALLPSPYVQSDHTEIRKTALKVTDGAANPLDKAKQISDWIHKTLDKRPVLGLPDALTTLNSKQGDCNEHAVLFAALARSAGIPTRIAAGVTLNRGAFYYHAWNEVCLGSKWISVDSTTNQFPADLTHIRFILGEMQEQVRIGGLLGKLAIEPIPKP